MIRSASRTQWTHRGQAAKVRSSSIASDAVEGLRAFVNILTQSLKPIVARQNHEGRHNGALLRTIDSWWTLFAVSVWPHISPSNAKSTICAHLVGSEIRPNISRTLLAEALGFFRLKIPLCAAFAFIASARTDIRPWLTLLASSASYLSRDRTGLASSARGAFIGHAEVTPRTVEAFRRASQAVSTCLANRAIYRQAAAETTGVTGSANGCLVVRSSCRTRATV